MINPAFLSYPEEARLLGAMVLGYGELDISFTLAAGTAVDQKFALLHAVNQVRSESARLDITHAIASGGFAKLGLAVEYAGMHKAMRFCLKVRNQWAHSQWGDWNPDGLGFTRTDGEVFALPIKPLRWNSITLPLLQKQEAFFEYTRRCILTVTTNLTPILSGKPALIKMPPEMHQPSMHSQWSKQVHARIETGPQSQP
ncbi:hypothetical protein [Mesorhizobium sp. M0199]|uniref:hypothetical protein n=1 Tax=Mesorhizobium sp. M0199 TaxID=2956911 RepID=UPI00333DE94B